MRAALRALFPAAVLLGAVVFALRSTLFSPGIPNFSQDWRWPFLSEQLRSALPDVLRVWDTWGLGEPRVRIVNHPALWIVHGLSFAFSSRTVLFIGLVVTFFSTAAGTVWLARCLRVRPITATCAGIAALLGPPLFNKYVAGQWYYLIALAALPWAVASAVRYDGKNAARAAVTGSLIALTSLQPQLWAASMALCAALFLLGPGRLDARRVLDTLLMLACGTVLTFPEIYGAVAAHSAQHYAGMQTIPMWEANNSAPFLEAFVGLGYAPHYVAHALAFAPWVPAVLWIVPIAVAFAPAARRHDLRVLVLAACWMTLLFLVMGIHGPFGAPIAFLYGKFFWASTFRELYHFAVPMWILAAVLAAVTFERMRAAGIVLAVATAGAAAVLWIPPNYAGTLRSWNFHDRSHALFAAARAPFATRFLLSPSIGPLGPAGAPYRGVDPDANAIGLWFPVNSAEQFGAIGTMELLGARDPVRYAGWLRAAGIDAVLARPYLQSAPIDRSPLDAREKQQAKRYFPPQHGVRAWRSQPQPLLEVRSSIPIVADPFSAQFRDGFVLERDALSDSHDPDAAPKAARADPQMPRNAWDPARTWVPAELWWWIDPQAAFWPHAAITWSDRPFPVPASFRSGAYAHIVLYRGTLLLGRRAVRAPLGKAVWVPLQGAGAIAVRDGAALLIEFARVQEPYRRARVPRNASSDRTLPEPFSVDCACASFTVPPGRSWVVLKESFDTDWQLRLRGGSVLRHMPFAGYGNAWEIQTAAASSASLLYTPAPVWGFLVNLSVFVWLAIAAAGVAGMRVRR